MTEDDEREVREAIQHVYTEIQRIEAESHARMAEINRRHRHFVYAWSAATVLYLLNLLTINEPVISHLYTFACLAWAAQGAYDLWRMSRKPR